MIMVGVVVAFLYISGGQLYLAGPVELKAYGYEELKTTTMPSASETREVTTSIIIRQPPPLIEYGETDGNGGLDQALVNIIFETREPGDPQALVDGDIVPSAQGKFAVSVTNNREFIPIQDVEFVSQSDSTVIACQTAATDEFEDPASELPWTMSDIANNDTYPDPAAETAWFDLECYATDDPSTITFTFNFQYDWFDELGGDHLDEPIVGNVDIEIYSEFCTDTSYIGAYNSLAEVCTFTPGVGLELIPDQTICETTLGGTWVTDHCEFACLVVGCDEVPSPGIVYRNTYCNGANQIEDCTQCVCYDYWGHESTGCNGVLCTFD